MGILAALAGLFLVLFMMDSAQHAASSLWVVVLLAALAVVVIALAAWHRRRMAEIQQLHLIAVGRWHNVSRFVPWPKYCRDCGQRAWTWKEARLHDEPDTSPCARYAHHRDEVEPAPAGLPMDGWQVDILGKEISRKGEPDE